jgi:hypothetical protein
VIADNSALLQWFVQVGQLDAINTFAKSTSDRFSRWVSEASVRRINERLSALLTMAELATGAEASPAVRFGLPEPLTFSEVFFDSTCLKANIHFPVDRVLLRDAARTLMKATVLIRKAGLKARMPQEPLEFLSDMNTLCMKMSGSRRAVDSKKRRKQVLRGMKALERRIAGHARAHLDSLRTRHEETTLTAGEVAVIIQRMEGVLKQLPAAIKQAHERIIGERQVANEDKILSLYDEDIIRPPATPRQTAWRSRSPTRPSSTAAGEDCHKWLNMGPSRHGMARNSQGFRAVSRLRNPPRDNGHGPARTPPS